MTANSLIFYTHNPSRLIHILQGFVVWFFAIIGLAACGNAQPVISQDGATKSAGLSAQERAGKTEIIVLGMVHGSHRQSRDYSLDRLTRIVRDIAPDIILTEIPKGRAAAAVSSYDETGRVTERRTRAFPEYTDSIIPLHQELGFEIYGTAAWTRALADNRRQALNRISEDPSRASQWQDWVMAQAAFRRTVRGRADDPLYIHTPEYDAAVAKRYQPYARYFEDDIGKGGWDSINAAHIANIHERLDDINGQGKRVLITYGAFHKYKILEALARRDDIVITNARPFIARNPA